VGFSLGANILVDVCSLLALHKYITIKHFYNRDVCCANFVCVQYLAEEGEACELRAAVVCSNPWDLHAGSLALQRSWMGREIYSKHMADGMRALFET